MTWTTPLPPPSAETSESGATPRVVFLAARGAHGVLLDFSREWAEAFAALGQPADVLDLDAPGGLEALGQIAEHDPPRAFVGFAGVGGDLQVDGQLLYDVIRVPYVGLMFDHPAYFWSRHLFASPYHTLLFTDPDFRAVSETLAPPGARRGAFRFGCTPPSHAPRPLRERKTRILVAKGGRIPNDIRAEWNDAFAVGERRVMDDVLAVALWDSSRPLWDVTLDAARLAGLPPGAERTRQFVAMVYALDEYIRSARALRALQALAPHRPVVIGGEWLAAGLGDDRLHVRAAMPLDGLLAEIEDAQVVLNLHPNNRLVPHERLIYGMQHGCLMLSDASPQLRETMGHDRFLPFNWHDPLEDVFADCLRDPSRHQDRADRAAAFANDAWHVSLGARSVLQGIMDAELAALTERFRTV